MLINILAITFGVIFVITSILAFIYGDISSNTKIKKIVYIILIFLITIIVSPPLVLVGYMFNSIISG